MPAVSQPSPPARNVLSAVALLLIPLVCQLAGLGINWDLADYVVMGCMLATVAYVSSVVRGRFPPGIKREVAVASVVVAFLILWAELAVGIFATPLAGS